MASQGQYLLITNFDRLTNKRCHAKDLNKTVTYRNNWCINNGDCVSCRIASSYESEAA